MAQLTGIAKLSVKAGLLTEAEALTHQEQSPEGFIHRAVSAGAVGAADMAEFLSDLFGLPLIDLDAFNLLDIESLKKILPENVMANHRLLPIYQRNKTLYIAQSDPTDVKMSDEIRFSTGMELVQLIVEDDKLSHVLNDLLETGDQVSLAQETNTKQGADEEQGTDVIALINKILLKAIQVGASDIHFEPYEKLYRIRYRVDGILKTVTKPSLSLSERFTARLKIMAHLDTAERRVPQDGRIKLQVSQKQSVDFRMSSLPTLWGEKICLRILDSSSAQADVNELGYDDIQKKRYLDALAKPQGMILVTGPTGSGKTVSLYAGLNILNDDIRNISTAEDPVEINLEGVNQVNVNLKVGLDFAKALKAFLRQDPDVVMVGEIRDLDTASIAVKAAQTGHLVLSTLHTNSAPETLTRLANMGVPSFSIATSVQLIIAQRLVRRLCADCKKSVQYNSKTLEAQGLTKDILNGKSPEFYEPQGCKKCVGGYKGRVGIYEVMQITPELSEIIMAEGNAIEIANEARRAGFDNLRTAGLKKAIEGLTSISEVARVTSE